MIHLRAIAKKQVNKNIDSFPLNLPLMKALKEINFSNSVTFFVGENGSGKSTLLEAIAAGVGSISVGGEDIQQDRTLDHARKLSTQLKFVWQKKTGRGFFLRAEDFFNFARRIKTLSQELEEQVSEYEQKFTGTGLWLAKRSVLGQKAALADKYGENLDANSHGESFLKLFQSRFVPGGLYLLDEPEAPLSPLRQLSLLSLLKDMVNQDSQFIIATHSPILMAFPQASILSFDTYPPQKVEYDALEHVTLTKAFLNNPQSFLRHL
ncbi:MAG: AAA family ATPase [Komarekiella atlantica HA4396-MV6]|jgi:predicted ATPase|nr:AAA family ATPase [Komarekiella atlantica HA4396-MV6]